MSSIELDMQLTLSADQIRRREFVSVRRGYDPDQVRAYLKQVGDQIEKLEDRARVAAARAAEALRAKAETEARLVEAAPAPAEVDPYSDLSERMANMLRMAERYSEDVRREAEEECAKMVAEARSAADKIRIDAQGTAEGLRQEADDLMRTARSDAQKMLSDLNPKRDALVAELEEMRARLLFMAQGIESVSEHESRELGLDLSEARPGPMSQPEPATSMVFSDPQFAELWLNPDPSDPAPAPTLEEVEPENPSQP